VIVDAEGGSNTSLGSFELAPGETLIVVARSLGTRVYARAIGGRRLEAQNTVTAGEAAVP
jgi:hypothetical protein